MLVNKYKETIEDFLNVKLSVDEFQMQYLGKSLEWSAKMDEDLFGNSKSGTESTDGY